MVQNADRMASICNGRGGRYLRRRLRFRGAAPTMRIGEKMGLSFYIRRRHIVAAFIAAFTVGGKAIGKRLAIKRSKDILMLTGRAAAFQRPFFKRK